MRENLLKKHYANYHFVNGEDVHFRDLFTPDTIDRKCRICCTSFERARIKKAHVSVSLWY